MYSKLFIDLLAALPFYAGQVSYAVTLPGVIHTVPFSPWSFGAYLGRLLPPVWVGALFFLTLLTSAWERRAAVLTVTTPADPRWCALAHCVAVLVGVALLRLEALALAALLYTCLLDWTDWGSLTLPAPVILAPPLVFTLGSGWLLDRLRPWLLYMWMLLPFALTALPLPEALRPRNDGLYTFYPLTLGMLDLTLFPPAAVWAVQGLFLAAGVLFLLVTRKGKKVYNQ